MEFAQPKGLLEDHGLDGVHHHGSHVLDDDGDPTARAPDGMVRIVGGRGLDVPQDTREAKGVPALADAGTNKVAETNGTYNIVITDRYALLDHPHRIPTHAVVRSMKGILVGVHLGWRSPR